MQNLPLLWERLSKADDCITLKTLLRQFGMDMGRPHSFVILNVDRDNAISNALQHDLPMPLLLMVHSYANDIYEVDIGNQKKQNVLRAQWIRFLNKYGMHQYQIENVFSALDTFIPQNFDMGHCMLNADWLFLVFLFLKQYEMGGFLYLLHQIAMLSKGFWIRHDPFCQYKLPTLLCLLQLAPCNPHCYCGLPRFQKFKKRKVK